MDIAHSKRLAIYISSNIADILHGMEYFDADQSQYLFDRLVDALENQPEEELMELLTYMGKPR